MKIRTLFIGTAPPWELDSGPSIRAQMVLQALSDAGSVDLCLIEDDDKAATPPPEHVGARRTAPVAWPDESEQPSRRFSFGRQSRGLIGVGADTVADLAKQAGGYDVIWAAGSEAFAIAKAAKTPVICDMSSQAIRDHAAREREVPEDLADRAAAVIVGGAAELGRLPNIDVSIVPYCFPAPGYPTGERIARQPPSLGLIGGLQGERGFEAIQWLMQEVHPLLQESMPDVQLRLVGSHDPGVAQVVGNHPNVTMTGWVPEVRPELKKIDVIVGVRRSGWGNPTRILEAFANRIPVVATPTATREIDIEDGVHALVRESASDFAEACLQAIADHKLRASLTVSAHTLFTERHSSSSASVAVINVVRKCLR